MVPMERALIIGNTLVNSVAIARYYSGWAINVVSGGTYYAGGQGDGQVCVWSFTLELQNVQTWDWRSTETQITSVLRGEFDADPTDEIITGGYCSNGAHHVAELCVWG